MITIFVLTAGIIKIEGAFPLAILIILFFCITYTRLNKEINSIE